jgi:hypothetical protein
MAVAVHSHRLANSVAKRATEFKGGIEMRVRVLLASVAVMLVAASSATPVALAANSVSHKYRVEYGNTYTAGTVTFYNQSVHAVGEHKATTGSGCRKTEIATYAAGGEILGSHATDESPVCSGSATYKLNAPARITGGAAYVEVSLMAPDARGHWQFVATKRVWR